MKPEDLAGELIYKAKVTLVKELNKESQPGSALWLIGLVVGGTGENNREHEEPARWEPATHLPTAS